MIKRNVIRRGLGIALWDILLPIRPIKKTVLAMGRSARSTLESAKVIQQLATDAKAILRDAASAQVDRDEVTFDMAMARRGPKSLNIAALKRHFLSRKRLVLSVGVGLVVVGATGLASAVARSDMLSFVLGFLGLVASTSLCFVMALSCEFRRWQLEVRRLARSEKGGLVDFRAERPDWVWRTLSPINRDISDDDFHR